MKRNPIGVRLLMSPSPARIRECPLTGDTLDFQ
jgi:hypothetical protein